MRARTFLFGLSTFGGAVVALGALAQGCTSTSPEVHGPSYSFEAGSDDAGAEDAGAGSDGTTVAVEGGMPEAAVADAPSVSDDASARTDGNVAGDAGAEAGGCTSLTVLVGGNNSLAFGASAVGPGAFVTQDLSSTMGSAPALAAFGGGLEALFASAGASGGPLYGVGFASGTWSSPVALGASAVAIDAPAIAVVGGALEGVYLNPQHLFFKAAFTSVWDTGTSPVEPPNDAGPQAFGPVRAAAAGTATDFVIAYEGNDGHGYAQTWTATAGWDDGVALGSAALLADTPLAIAPLTGGAVDLVAVYVDGEGAASSNNLHVFFSLRTAQTKAWSAPAMIGADVYTEAAPSIAAMSGGGAVVTWLGQSSGVYASVLSESGGSPSWSDPVQVTAASPAETASVARGVCGDDAIGAYLSDGAVYTTHFAGGSWTPPALLVGEAGITAVAIATSP